MRSRQGRFLRQFMRSGVKDPAQNRQICKASLNLRDRAQISVCRQIAQEIGLARNPLLKTGLLCV